MQKEIEDRWGFSDKPKVSCGIRKYYPNHDEITATFVFKFFTLNATITSIYGAEHCAELLFRDLNFHYTKALEAYLGILSDVTGVARTVVIFNGVEMTATEYATKHFMEKSK